MEYHEENLEENQAWFESDSNLLPSDIRKPFNWDLWLSPKHEIYSPDPFISNQSPSIQRSPQNKKEEIACCDMKEMDVGKCEDMLEEGEKIDTKRKRTLNGELRSSNGDSRSTLGNSFKINSQERWRKKILKDDLKDQKKQYKKWLKAKEVAKSRDFVLLGNLPPQPMKTQPEIIQSDLKQEVDRFRTIDDGRDDFISDSEKEDSKRIQEEFYQACYCDGITYKIGDWIGLKQGQRYYYGVIRYFFKAVTSHIYVYVTELILIGTGPPYSYKSFTFGDETFFSVSSIQEPLKMLKSRYL